MSRKFEDYVLAVTTGVLSNPEFYLENINRLGLTDNYKESFSKHRLPDLIIQLASAIKYVTIESDQYNI